MRGQSDDRLTAETKKLSCSVSAINVSRLSDFADYQILLCVKFIVIKDW